AVRSGPPGHGDGVGVILLGRVCVAVDRGVVGFIVTAPVVGVVGLVGAAAVLVAVAAGGVEVLPRLVQVVSRDVLGRCTGLLRDGRQRHPRHLAGQRTDGAGAV